MKRAFVTLALLGLLASSQASCSFFSGGRGSESQAARANDNAAAASADAPPAASPTPQTAEQTDARTLVERDGRAGAAHLALVKERRDGRPLRVVRDRPLRTIHGGRLSPFHPLRPPV